MKAVQILMDEHQLILRGLAVGREMARRLRAGEEVPGEDVSSLADFLAQYADAHHHAKEEDLLFPWMHSKGFPKEQGPIVCMLHEHVVGRELRARIAEGAGGLPETYKRVAHCLDEFANLLESHIMKEDQILYPMARELGDGDAELLPAYQEAVPDADKVEARFQALVTDLESRYGGGKAEGSASTAA